MNLQITNKVSNNIYVYEKIQAMNKNIKRSIYAALFQGLFFASLMALIDNYNEKEFHIIGFLMRTIIFGSFMGVLAYYQMEKREKNE